jgi:hypothetical protein
MADQLDFKPVMNAMLKARDLYVQTGNEGGLFRCEKCQTGEVRWQVVSNKKNSRSRLFSRGQCSTEGCIAWIE